MGPIGWAKTANPSTATRHNGARTISQLRRTTMAVAPIRLGRDQPKRHSITGSGYIAALANEQGFAYTDGPAEVYVGWRADFTDSDRADWPKLAVSPPPPSDELMALPFGSFKRWLAGAESTLSDVEGDTDRAGRAAPQTLLLRWDPESPQVISAAEVRPGDTVILPAADGGPERFGFNPLSGLDRKST